MIKFIDKIKDNGKDAKLPRTTTYVDFDLPGSKPKIKANIMESLSNKPKRSIKDKPTTRNTKFRRNIALGLSAIALAGAIGLGVGITNRDNARMDSIHKAYQITESLNDTRAVNTKGYTDYMKIMESLDRIHEATDEKNFHDTVRQVNLENTVLNPERVIDLALETFKVTFAKEHNANPQNVNVSYKVKDVESPRPDFDYEIGRYKYTSITYKDNLKDEYVELARKEFIPGTFDLAGLTQTGDTTIYRDDLSEAEYNAIKAIAEAQGDKDNIKKAMEALETVNNYTKEIEQLKEQDNVR